jgi:hypothetical protein
VRRAGGMLADKRTPGVVDIADTSIELLATDYEALVLPRLPRHGGTLVEFVITANVYHPSVLGSFAILCDRARIAKVEGPDFDATEKGLVMKLGVSVMNTWHKGRDGEWKCMALVPTLPSSQAVPLLKF